MEPKNNDFIDSILMYEVTYYVNADLGDCANQEPMIYTPTPALFDTFEMREELSEDESAALLQHLAFSSSVYHISETLDLEIKLKEIIQHSESCPLVLWGGEGIVVAGCDPAYRLSIAFRMPNILKRMIYGIRKTLMLYILCNQFGFYIGAQIEQIRDAQQGFCPVFKVTYFK
jgi:hypothetical protein